MKESIKEIEKMTTFTEDEIKYLIDIMAEQMTARFVYREEKQKIVESVFRKIAKLLN